MKRLLLLTIWGSLVGCNTPATEEKETTTETQHTAVVAEATSSAETDVAPATAITVATATEPKATDVLRKAYLVVLLFLISDI